MTQQAGRRTTLSSLEEVAAAHTSGMPRHEAFTAYFAGLPPEVLARRLAWVRTTLAEAQAAHDPRLQPVYIRHIEWMERAQAD